MRDEIVQLIIYLVIGAIGVLFSATKNKKRPQQSSGETHIPPPKTLTADPPRDFSPDLGPLLEMFDIPRKEPEKPWYDTVEDGPTVEEAGMNVDTEKASLELAGMNAESEGKMMESQVSAVEAFEEGQSDIQKMIAKYEALQLEYEQQVSDDVTEGEIVSVDTEKTPGYKASETGSYFDARKAIIYAEILKRKEF